MACVTLKRPLEWVDPSMSPEHGHHSQFHSPGSPTSMMVISKSPPHSSSFASNGSCAYSAANHYSPMAALPSKRPCLGAGVHAATSSSSSTSSANSVFKSPVKSGDIAKQIHEEMLKLKMIRHRLVKNNSNNNNNNNSSSSSSSSSSTPVEEPRESSTTDTTTTNSNSTTSTSSSSSSLKRTRTNSTTTTSSSSNNNNSKAALFTFEQVVMIVDRLLAEKEDAIRREYEVALTNRLEEQYEQFVKFSYDQIQRRFDASALPSYLS